MNTQTATKYTAIVIGLIAIGSFLQWTSKRDKAMMQRYENCQWEQVEVYLDGKAQWEYQCYE